MSIEDKRITNKLELRNERLRSKLNRLNKNLYQKNKELI